MTSAGWTSGVPRETIRAFAGLAGPYDFLPLTDAATRRTFRSCR
ncbi:MAG: hypothetical protein R3D43_01885 [Tepidamorphaceae bacterium]